MFDKGPRHRIVWCNALTNFIADHNNWAGGLGETLAKRGTCALNIPLGHHEVAQPQRDAIEQDNFVWLSRRQSLGKIQRRLYGGPIWSALQAVLRNFDAHFIIPGLRSCDIAPRPAGGDNQLFGNS